MSRRDDTVCFAGGCSSCGCDVVNGICEVCNKPAGARAQVEEPQEPATKITLLSERPPITFAVGALPQIEIPPRKAGDSVRVDTTLHQGGLVERVSRQRRVGLAACAVLVLSLPVVLAQFWNFASPDPLSQFSVITGIGTQDAQIEDWSRRQFATSDGLESAGRIARARSALEHSMAAAIARDEGSSVNWNEIAAWANIARALGVHDNDMLELAADLNVQLALYKPTHSEAGGLERLARARALLHARRGASLDDSEVARIERKLADLDRMELALRETRGGRR